MALREYTEGQNTTTAMSHSNENVFLIWRFSGRLASDHKIMHKGGIVGNKDGGQTIKGNYQKRRKCG